MRPDRAAALHRRTVPASGSSAVPVCVKPYSAKIQVEASCRRQRVGDQCSHHTGRRLYLAYYITQRPHTALGFHPPQGRVAA